MGAAAPRNTLMDSIIAQISSHNVFKISGNFPFNEYIIIIRNLKTKQVSWVNPTHVQLVSLGTGAVFSFMSLCENKNCFTIFKSKTIQTATILDIIITDYPMSIIQTMSSRMEFNSGN